MLVSMCFKLNVQFTRVDHLITLEIVKTKATVTQSIAIIPAIIGPLSASAETSHPPPLTSNLFLLVPFPNKYKNKSVWNFHSGYEEVIRVNTPARIPGLSVTKHFQLRMACKVADKSERGSTGILGAFWTFFISITGIKFPI